MDVVVVKHYDLLGKIRELYVTSGFSSGTHNSCRLICLRFNPMKMSEWRRHFLFYNVLVEFISNYRCFKVTLDFGFWPAQIEDCPVKWF